MKLLHIATMVLLACAAAAACSEQKSTPDNPKRPNILLIVADDLGYSDLGSYGGEINTPNLDKLASAGTKLTNFHVAPTCSPTRSMIMSGTYNHRAGLGAMAEWTAPNQRNKPGYEGFLNDRVAALPQLLLDAGYSTFMAGKWHLGMQTDQGPYSWGFDHSFAMLPGAGNHFSDRGLNPHLPTVPYRENGQAVKPPDNFYSTEFYTDKAIEYIEKVRRSDQPFFGYLAYTAPHWPLQVPAQYSDKYKGKYDGGYANVRNDRLARMKNLGILSEGKTPDPGSDCYPDWESLTAVQRAHQARAMEIYAGMVDALDEHIGRLVDHLKNIGEFDNTVLVFMSDNGADARPPNGIAQEAEFVAGHFDNQLENLGNENSFVSYGGAWAQVGSTPFRLHKGMVTEGGIRAPAIIHYPAGDYRTGVTHEFASVMDLMPSFLEIAGVEHPGERYQGRPVWSPTGKSMIAYITGEADIVHKEPFYGFSVHSAQGLQLGEWKAVRLREPHGNGNWELFNLSDDPGETRNLSEIFPDQLARMIEQWQDFATSTGIIIAEPGSRKPRECLLPPEQ